MAEPTTRDEFVEYCLRRLGAPVLEINLAPEQIDDRLDDALRVFLRYDIDGITRLYLHHNITQDDYDNRYITIPDYIVSVVKMFNATDVRGTLFDIKYNFAMSDLYYYGAMDITGYAISRQYLGMLNDIFRPEKTLRFNRLQSKLYIETDWTKNLMVGELTVFECYRVIDPEETSAIWKDEMLKELATAYLKKQWGENLSKFNGIQIAGGATLNSQAILDSAKIEVENAEKKLRAAYEFPPMMSIG